MTRSTGWHPDPEQDGAVRWWDGEQWSDLAPDGSRPRPAREPDRLESVGLGPRAMVIAILVLVAGAFVYYVLLGGDPPQR